MIKTNHVERAYRAWPILTRAAKEKKLLTYSEIGTQLGIHPKVVGYTLGPIQDYCLDEKLPPLTILVVGKASGKPGDGFVAWDIDDASTGVEKVYEYNWSNEENPFQYASDGSTEESIVDELFSNPDSSELIYAKVKVRGVAQKIFRKLLLRAYDEECAFCRLSFPEALQAAHIVPWAKSEKEQRLDPSNGILLCSTHHHLFDSAYLTISESHKIIYYDPDEDEGPYSNIDKRVSVALHGKKMKMPTHVEHQPSTVHIRQANKIRTWPRLK